MNMKVIIGLSLCLLFGNANATMFTFDDVPGGGSTQNGLGRINDYNSYNFSSQLYWIDVVDSSYNYGSVSGDFAMLNNSSGIGTITEESGADFTFDGLWAKKWATAPESGGTDSLFGTLSGYNNGVLVWEVATALNGSYEFYESHAEAIDELRVAFGEGNGAHYLVDDLELSAVTPPPSVPVPATILLFGFGLVGLVGIRKKK